MTHYAPSCPACRQHDTEIFHQACQGCQARKARLEAERGAPPVTNGQIDGMDSTHQPLQSPGKK